MSETRKNCAKNVNVPAWRPWLGFATLRAAASNTPTIPRGGCGVSRRSCAAAPAPPASFPCCPCCACSSRPECAAARHAAARQRLDREAPCCATPRGGHGSGFSTRGREDRGTRSGLSGLASQHLARWPLTASTESSAARSAPADNPARHLEVQAADSTASARQCQLEMPRSRCGAPGRLAGQSSTALSRARHEGPPPQPAARAFPSTHSAALRRSLRRVSAALRRCPLPCGAAGACAAWRRRRLRA